MDYAGAILFIAAATLILIGIVYTTTLPSDDPKVIGTLVAGFIALLAFALWETFAPLKQPLTPTHVFTRDKGRELTAPFIVGFVVTMFYYAVNIICEYSLAKSVITNTDKDPDPTQVGVFFTDATTDYKYAIVLGLPGNIGNDDTPDLRVHWLTRYRTVLWCFSPYSPWAQDRTLEMDLDRICHCHGRIWSSTSSR